jgi:hypothetical protein
LTAPDPSVSRKLYVDVLGLPLESQGGDYHHSEQIVGCKSFGIWPQSQAAEACFGTPQWPTERPVPQVSIEVARLQSPEGAIVGISYAPVLHDQGCWRTTSRYDRWAAARSYAEVTRSPAFFGPALLAANARSVSLAMSA